MLKLCKTIYRSENTRIIGVIGYMDFAKNYTLVFLEDHKGEHNNLDCEFVVLE
jgi:hypothetical protein